MVFTRYLAHDNLSFSQVHRCYLLREPSAFGDMFSLPVIEGSKEGLSDDAPIPLSDTAEQFQDLLWVLYALYVLRSTLTSIAIFTIEFLKNADRAN